MMMVMVMWAQMMMETDDGEDKAFAKVGIGEGEH
jgi:hypothetical protein